MLLILGTMISQAMSRPFLEASLVERHEQWMAQYGRNYANNAEKKKRFKILENQRKIIDKEDFSKNQNLCSETRLCNEKMLGIHFPRFEDRSSRN